MNINSLALNTGNSRLTIGEFSAGEPKSVIRVGHDPRCEWPRVFGKLGEACRP